MSPADDTAFIPFACVNLPTCPVFFTIREISNILLLPSFSTFHLPPVSILFFRSTFDPVVRRVSGGLVIVGRWECSVNLDIFTIGQNSIPHTEEVDTIIYQFELLHLVCRLCSNTKICIDNYAFLIVTLLHHAWLDRASRCVRRAHVHPSFFCVPIWLLMWKIQEKNIWKCANIPEAIKL